MMIWHRCCQTKSCVNFKEKIFELLFCSIQFKVSFGIHNSEINGLNNDQFDPRIKKNVFFICRSLVLFSVLCVVLRWGVFVSKIFREIDFTKGNV